MYPKMPLKTMVVSCRDSHQLTPFPAPSCLAWPPAPPSVPSKCLFCSHRSNSRWRAGLLAGWKDGGRRGGDGDGDRVLSYHMLSGSQRFVGEQFGRGGRWSRGRAREGTRWSRGGGITNQECMSGGEGEGEEQDQDPRWEEELDVYVCFLGCLRLPL